VDLVPIVVAVKHPGADDADMSSEYGAGDVTPGADTEIRHVPDNDRLAGRATGLVARHDLDV
jgi:hypothetical protein